MFATLIRLELAHLEGLTHNQLVALLLESSDPFGFDRGWLETQPIDQLRLFVLAAKLLHILRQKEMAMVNYRVRMK
jgi:hypothetical protein